MPPLAFTRTLSGLSAADDAARNALRKIDCGATVHMELVNRRTHRNLARWWLLCQLVLDNSEQFASKEQVSDYLKVRAGHCDQIVSKATGEIYLIAKSIAFGRLAEDDFIGVLRRGAEAACGHILLGTDSDALLTEVLKLGGLAR